MALAEIRISCRGENDLLPIALIVYSFCDVTALSCRRLVMPTRFLRVGLSHEPVALVEISSRAAVRKISSRLGSALRARVDSFCLKKHPQQKLRAFTKRAVAQ